MAYKSNEYIHRTEDSFSVRIFWSRMASFVWSGLIRDLHKLFMFLYFILFLIWVLRPFQECFYGRHHDLVNPYNVAVSRIVSDVFASDAP